MMKNKQTADIKLGVLGGGQLGKMLIQAASCFDLKLHIIDPNPNAPASPLTPNFTVGDFTDFQNVYDFGQGLDVVTIEIENVNVEALRKLEKEGTTVNPSPEIIALIQDKGLQKEFYANNQLPTSDYVLFNNAQDVKNAIESGTIQYPFVQKLRTEGYDGKGVSLINGEEDLHKLFDAPSVVEDKVDIDKEVAVIVARNANDEVSCFPLVEMQFNPEANLVEFLSAPAKVSEEVEQLANDIAVKLAKALKLQGILAVELFVSKDGEVLINESAPRPHNSGHQSIEANITSQYEQHLRAVLNWPLGSTKHTSNATMVNLLGEPGHTGKAVYEGLEEVMKIEGAKVHLYGKRDTKPFRKMGHITIIDEHLDEAIQKAKKIKQTLKIIT